MAAPEFIDRLCRRVAMEQGWRTMHFDTLPIFPDTTGIGLTRRLYPTAFHLNRFRACVAPPANAFAAAAYQKIGAALLGRMHEYMNAHTAKVVAMQPRWADRDALRFTGVARVKPFAVPIYNPLTGQWIHVDVPEKLRDWMIPDIHDDWVGVKPETVTATGFTAQTLKRNFPDGTDVFIKVALREALELVESFAWWDVPVAVALAGMEEVLSAYLVWVNQHHFLAGRRSFRFVEGKAFGYTDGRWVFETAAMERFSLLPYAASELVMGRAEDVVRPVWVEMVKQVCKLNGLTAIPDDGRCAGWGIEGPVYYLQQRFYSYPGMLMSHDGATLDQQHLVIHPK